MAHENVWASKIVSYGDVELEQVLANEHNWKVHPTFAQEALAGALDDVGIVQNIIINKRLGDEWAPGERGVETLVDGHRRVMVGLRRGQRTWPVTYVNLTPSEEKHVLLTLDPLVSLAKADEEHLAQLLADVQSQDAAITHMLGQLALEHGLTDGAAPQVTFPAYDASVEESVTYHECPSCHHRWPQ